jgi:hypothetical protein
MKDPVFKLSRAKGAPVSGAELLADLKKVAGLLSSTTVPQKEYGEMGVYDYSTLIRRFGSWKVPRIKIFLTKHRLNKKCGKAPCN